jgi:glycosyltransferase involved in cell wall biosynthesis
MRRFFGISYSFTGHANDLFCEEQFPVTLDDLIGESRFVATVSDFSRRWLSEKYPAAASKFHRVYNGIQVDRFQRGESAAPPVILSVGRYIEKKGFGDLIEACRLLRDQGVAFRCLIVGTGPLEEALKTQVDSAGLKGSVEVTGPRSEKEVIMLLSTAEIFALPCTTDQEGGMDNLPTVIMEAMAAGLPVVSTPLAGVPEMMVEGKTGLMAGERCPEELAESISMILKDKALAQEMGRAGQRMAEERFAVGVTARQLKRLLVRRGRARLNFRMIKEDPGLLVDCLTGCLGG